MGHHQALELCERSGSFVILTEHSNCERGFLKDVYCPRLVEELNTSVGDGDGLENIEVLFSEIDSDPLKIV